MTPSLSRWNEPRKALSKALATLTCVLLLGFASCREGDSRARPDAVPPGPVTGGAAEDVEGSQAPAGGESGPVGAESDPEPALEPVPTKEELLAALDRVPAELTPRVDPDLAEEGDPQGFPLASHIGDVPVRIVRERNPDTGALQHIYTVRADLEGDVGRPIVHGPRWTYGDNGSQSALEWRKDDVLHGPAKQWRPVGSLKFERRFVDGQRDGISRSYSKAGKLLVEERFHDGVRDGLVMEWFASGAPKEETHYLNGKRHGMHKVYARTGGLMRREEWADDQLHGMATEFHVESGAPATWGRFEAGKRVGIWQKGTPEGTIESSRGFKDNLPHGETRIWTPDGTLVEVTQYDHGRKTGTARTWYSSGKLQSEGTFQDGERVGRWVYWRTDGTLNEGWSGTYEADVRTGPLDAGDPAFSSEGSAQPAQLQSAQPQSSEPQSAEGSGR